MTPSRRAAAPRSAALGRRSARRAALWRRVVWLIALALLCRGDWVIAAPLDVANAGPAVDLAPHALYIADVSDEIDVIEALRLARSGAFAPYDVGFIRFDAARPTHWLFVVLENSGTAPLRRILDLGLRLSPFAEVYVADGDLVRQVFRQDATTHAADRPIDAPSLVAPIDIEAGRTLDLLIRVRVNTDLSLAPTLQTSDVYYQDRLTEARRQFVFYGFLACFAISSLAVSIALREPSAVAYAGYVGAIMLYVLHIDGLAYRHLWPAAPVWSDAAQRPLQLAVTFFGAVFARSFFRTRETMPLFDAIFFGVIVVSVVGALSALASDHRIFSLLAFVVLVVSAQLYWIAGVVAVRRGLPGAWLFLTGAASVALAGVFAAVAHLAPNVASLEATRDWGRVAFVTEAFAFLLAIGGKIARVRRDRETSAAQAIDALEQKLALTEELRSAEDAFHRAAQLAEERRTAMAHATHDLRQPLTSMRLALKALNGAQPGDFAELERQCAYLESLIERYLDDAVEDGGRDDVMEPDIGETGNEIVPARLLLETAHAMFRDEAAAKGLELRLVDTTLRVEADPMAAVRILSNFVSNAVRHTETGGVLIGARRAGRRVRFVVYDTGPGLDAAQQVTLSRPGARSDASEGKGLGLAVAHDLAEKHGFDLMVRSTPDRGSCFGFSVDRAT